MNTKDKMLIGLMITTGVLTVKEIRDIILRKSKGKVVAMKCGDHPLPPLFDSIQDMIWPPTIAQLAPSLHKSIMAKLKPKDHKARSRETKIIVTYINIIGNNGRIEEVERSISCDGKTVYSDTISDRMFCYRLEHPDLLTALQLFCAGEGSFYVGNKEGTINQKEETL